MLQTDTDTRETVVSDSEPSATDGKREKNYVMPNTDDELLDSVDAAARRPLTATLIKIIAGVLLVCSIVMFISGAIMYSEFKVERERLEREISILEEEIEEDEYLLDLPVTDREYIIRIAKEYLRLFLPDEIVYFSDLNS